MLTHQDDHSKLSEKNLGFELIFVCYYCFECMDCGNKHEFFRQCTLNKMNRQGITHPRRHHNTNTVSELHHILHRPLSPKLLHLYRLLDLLSFQDKQN